ncbi:MAG: acetyltransferase [Bacteroidales bacterium]
MTDIIIVGSGGHGAEIHEYILFHAQYTGRKDFNIIGMLDDKKDYYDRYSYTAPFLGPITGHVIAKNASYIIAIANIRVRKMVVEDYLSKGARFITFIHPTAYISPTASIGTGVVIGPHANIGPNAKIGDYCLINSRCSIAHDSVLGSFNCLSPNVCLSGATIVGDGNFFGINSATLQGIKIGNFNTIQAGMIIDMEIGNETTVFHRFKEKVIAKPKE